MGLIDFLKLNKDTNKIVIVSNINKKAYKQIKEYPNTEIFWDYELLTNLIDFVYIPKHVLLTEEEMKTFENKYFSTKRETPKLDNLDPVARYYNLKVNDIIKIIRPSINSGYTISYRRVINYGSARRCLVAALPACAHHRLARTRVGCGHYFAVSQRGHLGDYPEKPGQQRRSIFGR